MDESSRLLKKEPGETIGSNKWMVSFELFYRLFTLLENYLPKA
jgi:hypothetical protein